jgi:hypothetical protein
MVAAAWPLGFRPPQEVLWHTVVCRDLGKRDDTKESTWNAEVSVVGECNQVIHCY